MGVWQVRLFSKNYYVFYDVDHGIALLGHIYKIIEITTVKGEYPSAYSKG